MPELPYSAGTAMQREAALHLAFDQIVVGAARGAGALPREDAVVIAVIGDRLLAGLVALGRSLRGEIAERARRLSLGGRPIEAILLSRMAHDPLRIDAVAKACRIECGIFVLRLDVSERDLDRGKLVAADAPPQDFIEPRLRVELPLAGIVDERDREGPVVVADDQRLRAVALELDRVLGIIG